MLCSQMPYKMPKHIVNLLLLLGSFLLIALAAKIYLTDPSFYRFGHYRADAVPELAAGTPLYKGAAYCQTCHEERLADWSVGVHATVQCEVCHGTNQYHPDDGKTLIPADTIKLCTICHEAMPARPATQPQIVVSEHPFPSEETEQCHACHDPHSPGDGEQDEGAQEIGAQATTAAEAPVGVPTASSKCAKCHGKRGEGRKKNPALAGLESAIFIELMNKYKSGAGENKKMIKFARELNDEEITELAKYYESLPATAPR
jgi:predicted CXXCH cytochrome family protein